MLYSQSVIDAGARQCFPFFMRKVFSIANPNTPLRDNWHLDAICYEVECVIAGVTSRLIVNVPPRTLKSLITSVALPAFLIGHDPSRKVMVVSHNLELAKQHALTFNRVVNDPWIKKTFKGLCGTPKADNDRHFITKSGGGRFSHSIESGITGQGADFIIIDDPLDASKGDNFESCHAVNRWYGRTLHSRLDNPESSSIIIVMQRLALNDLCAYVRTTEAWHELVLPAQAKVDRVIKIGKSAAHKWKTGEPLHPDHLSLKTLEAKKKLMGKAAYAAQYMQAPIPGGGGLIDVERIKRWKVRPKTRDQRIFSIDAGSAADGNSWSVILVFDRIGDTLFLVGLWREKVDFPDLLAKVHTVIKKLNPDKILVENTANGRPLLQQLFQDLPAENRRKLLEPIQPTISKIARMERALVKLYGGEMLIPANVEWNDILLNELGSFPGGKNDDIVDAISQAVNWVQNELKNESRVTLISRK